MNNVRRPRALRGAFVVACALGLCLSVSSAARADEPVPAPSGPTGLSVNVDGQAVSESAATILVTGVGAALTPGTEAALAWTGVGVPHADQRVTVGADGIARFSVSGWKDVSVTAAWGSLTQASVVHYSPTAPEVTFPAGAPKPTPRGVEDPPARGVGARAHVGPVSAAQRKAMTGVSWSRSCTPISNLRSVSVNYWGVDGYRHRGVLIARSDVARALAGAFTRLYAGKYRFHSIHPVDRYGRLANGPGADDYASMKAGNTSVFNCRYVVGQEKARAWSPHMSGRAVDINPFENPYVARGGVLPDSYWLTRRTQTPLGIIKGGLVTSVMKKYGWAWGGSYKDYHHFDYRG